MTGSTLIIEFHGYRGFDRVGGPLGSALTLGFITVTWMPFLLEEWLRKKIDALKKVSGESRGFVEMACAGESSDNANERQKLSNVPWNGKPIHK